jgi:hypothetical protein
MPAGRKAMAAGFALLAVAVLGWSVFRSVNANTNIVNPPTADDLLKSMQSADKQIEEVTRNPNMNESQKQQVIGLIRGGRSRLEAQYNKLKSGQKLTGPG